MRRALAIIAAILMIGVAFAIRSRGESRDEQEQKAASEITGTLVCATEVRAVCDELALANPTMKVRVEEAGVTAAILSANNFNAQSAGLDAWLVPQPYPGVVADNRQQGAMEAALDDPSAVLARSPVVAVAWNDRLKALQARCPDTPVTWSCIGDVAGDLWSTVGGDTSWGKVKPGHPPPDTTATGLLVLSGATSQRVGRSDFARNDLDNADYTSWLSKLERAVPTFSPSAGTALAQMLQQGRSSFDVAGSIEAIAGPAVTGSRDQANLTVIYPSPMATADLVVTAVRGSEQGIRIARLLTSTDQGASFARNGWRVTGQPGASGIPATPTMPDANGLPKPGALVALVETWKAVR